MIIAQHLSVRIPWKDNGYNGFVCNKPCFNNACLRLKNIAGARNDEFESSIAGAAVKGHENEIPCVNEGGCFIYPPFSFPARPYAWTMLNKSGQNNNENIKGLIEKYDIGFDPAKEPDLYFKTNWAQDAENQREIFKTFIDRNIMWR